MTESRDAVLARIKALEPTIKRVCEIAGTPGISVGVSYEGEPIYTLNHGFREIASSLPVDSSTIFPIGTLAKTFTASAIGMLVHKGLVEWDTPIRQIIPEFRSKSEIVEKDLNVLDLLVQRAGLERSNLWWQGSDGALLKQKEDLLRMYATFPKLGTFRADWAYSNWGYALLGEVIERVSGVDFAQCVAQNVLSPLGLKDTTMGRLDEIERPNHAKPYAAMDDASAYLMPQPPVSADTIMGPAMGGVSSAKDLLKYSMALLQSHRFESGADKSGPDPILKNGLMHLSGHVFTAKATLEKSYAFGFYRTQLPNSVLGMGWNSLYVKSMPKLIPRKNYGPVIAHGGSLPGYHSSIALLPEVNSSVVVCTNSIALGDVSGWASLAILEALIDDPQPSDFVSLATEAAHNNALNVVKLQKKLDQEKTKEISSRPLDDYVGRYADHLHDWIIDIRKKENNQLQVAFQGLESQTWYLNHYEADTFLWLAPREEQARRGRMTTYPLIANHFKIIFQANDNGIFDRLSWPHEAGVSVGDQSFFKVSC